MMRCSSLAVGLVLLTACGESKPPAASTPPKVLEAPSAASAVTAPATASPGGILTLTTETTESLCAGGPVGGGKTTCPTTPVRITASMGGKTFTIFAKASGSERKPDGVSSACAASNESLGNVEGAPKDAKVVAACGGIVLWIEKGGDGAFALVQGNVSPGEKFAPKGPVPAKLDAASIKRHVLPGEPSSVDAKTIPVTK